MWSEKILRFFRQLAIKPRLPKGVEVLNPYHNETTFSLCHAFYDRYYKDSSPRHLILGINPGRLGGGLTGIPFTDPKKLEQVCGIENALPKKSELSADFIYSMINQVGGPTAFYSQFYVSSVSPLGFTFDGKNLNYYDLPKLEQALKPFIVDCLAQQIEFGINRETCFIWGEGKNFGYVRQLNDELQYFKKLVPLPHPRFVMQYKRKSLQQYVDQYTNAFRPYLG
jgi:uracil DNA glycosylase superfamily protein